MGNGLAYHFGGGYDLQGIHHASKPLGAHASLLKSASVSIVESNCNSLREQIGFQEHYFDSGPPFTTIIWIKLSKKYGNGYNAIACYHCKSIWLRLEH